VNLATVLTASAARVPERPALRLGERTVTYAELDVLSSRVAGHLIAQGITPGDRVALMLPNVPEFAPVYYGILRAGGVVVPMNPMLKGREVDYYVSDSGAKLLIDTAALEGFFDHEPVATVVERETQDTAVILYTSGTTGHPKGAELTHGNLVNNVDVCQGDLLRLDPTDVVFGGLPLFHSFGQTVTLNTTIAAGASLVLLPRFVPKAALDLLSEQQATVFAGVPTMYSAMLAVPDAPEVQSLRACVSGGAALPVEVLHRFEERFGCAVLEGYGLSETSPVASFNQPDKARKPGSIGTPVSGVEMQVVDADGVPMKEGEAGEIAIRGHNVMKGYWNKPDATAEVLSEDGWFLTGDIGKQDEDGYFFIVDRKKELIIRGGFNVYPREIEEVLYEHPAVAEAAVVGVPHPELGEEVGAAITLKEGAVATVDELRDHVRSQVAPYKYPRVVWLVDTLPKGTTGKIQKREIVPPARAEEVAR
jgi:long-chain acyl-CoA synthetase